MRNDESRSLWGDAKACEPLPYLHNAKMQVLGTGLKQVLGQLLFVIRLCVCVCVYMCVCVFFESVPHCCWAFGLVSSTAACQGAGEGRLESVRSPLSPDRWPTSIAQALIRPLHDPCAALSLSIS